MLRLEWRRSRLTYLRERRGKKLCVRLWSIFEQGEVVRLRLLRLRLLRLRLLRLRLLRLRLLRLRLLRLRLLRLRLLRLRLLYFAPAEGGGRRRRGERGSG